MEHEVWYKYPQAVNHLPDDIFFITTQEHIRYVSKYERKRKRKRHHKRTWLRICDANLVINYQTMKNTMVVLQTMMTGH